MTKEKISSTTLSVLLFALFFTVWGITMLVRDIQVIGYRARYGQYSVLGGPILILIGAIFWYVTYQTLSPFSRIRQFFEKKRRK